MPRGRKPTAPVAAPWLPRTLEDAEFAAALDDGPPVDLLDALGSKDAANAREETRKALRALPRAYLTLPPGMVPPHEFTTRLPEIERLAFQGLAPETIAARLGVDTVTLKNAAVDYRDVWLALVGGAARAADELSAVVIHAGLGGDVGSAWRMLGIRHGFKEADAGPPPVTINVQSTGTPVTFTRADELAAAQAEVLALSFEEDSGEVIEAEAEGES